ncbi:MAG: U32 family peptidase [Candidatus Gracilibacteria bacterium]|nr:U32 family peptidase [Candidatus Gracilibacteria bacterium]
MFKKIVGLGFSIKGKNHKDIEKYISSLVEGGANEFFTGYNPSYWHEKFGFEVSPNGRFAEHEQITDFESLKAITQEVHKHNLEIFVNLNAWYYTDVTFPFIKQMVGEFIEIGIDGIICGNISILEYLKSINYSGKINISTILALYNSESIRFFLDNYKVNKIILSREITLKEIEKLVSSFPETKFEVFGEGDFCRYNNGLCFAEHKYSTRDICTVVVNDLIFKKKFRVDFKKIVLDSSLSDIEKVTYFDDKFEDIFEKIQNILGKIELGFLESKSLFKELLNIVLQNSKRIDLFFDSLKPLNEKSNLNTLTFFKAVKSLLNNNIDIEENILNELNILQEELNNSFKSYVKFNINKIKEIGGEPKLKALEIGSFYAKSDNLNLYSYLFFSKFPNIETVKFPTRGRNYNEKLKVIEQTIENKKVDENLLDRGISLERAHYDLTYLFGDKLWFRKMLSRKV